MALALTARDRPEPSSEPVNSNGAGGGDIAPEDAVPGDWQRWATSLLRDERQAALHRVDELTAELASVAEAATTEGRDDEHDPDGATTAFDQSLTAGLLLQARRRLAEVDLSLERLHRGTYGYCEGCGVMIAEERLEARPTTVICVKCAAAPSGRDPPRPSGPSPRRPRH